MAETSVKPNESNGSVTSEDTMLSAPLDVYNSQIEAVIVTAMLSVFLAVGVAGNGLTFYIFYRSHDKTTARVFILWLSATDFFVCLINVPIKLTRDTVRSNDFFCKSSGFLLVAGVSLCIFIITAISVDRYLCICYPFLSAITIPRAQKCLFCLTFLACVVATIDSLSLGVCDTTQIESPKHNSLTSTTPSVIAVIYSTSTQERNIPRDRVMKNRRKANRRRANKTQTPAPLVRSYQAVSPTANDILLSNSTARSYVNHTRDYNYNLNYTGRCCRNFIYLSNGFFKVYWRCVDAVYILSFLTILLLYALIYRSILIRRKYKAERKEMSQYSSTSEPEASSAATQLKNGGTKYISTSLASNSRMVIANVKTATILFVVAIVFIISYFPVWLALLGVINKNNILVNLIFLNNVVNPIIYAFMNQKFRNDIKQLLKRLKEILYQY